MDVLLLEDETGRISLTGNILRILGQLVTGVVVAVKGREKVLGEFEVSEWVFSSGGELQTLTSSDDMTPHDHDDNQEEDLASGIYIHMCVYVCVCIYMYMCVCVGVQACILQYQHNNNPLV